jgi:hypothetical protein
MHQASESGYFCLASTSYKCLRTIEDGALLHRLSASQPQMTMGPSLPPENEANSTDFNSG